MFHRLALVPVLAALSACALQFGYGLRTGQTSEAQARSALGRPAEEYQDADGSRTLAYPTGPAGVQTFLVRIGPDGRLAAIDQVLLEEQFRRIERGKTTGEEVRRLLGPPWRTIDFPNKRQVAWDYHFQDAWGYDAEFSVMIDERGVVAETVTVRLAYRRGRD